MKKKILSLFLAIVMIVTSISVWPGQEEAHAETTGEKTYKELTFRDFGLGDGPYISKCWKQNTELTTLDGVAITGDMIFTQTSGDGFNTGFRLSPIGSNNCDWNNFQIFHRNNASGNFIGVRYVGYGTFALNFTTDELEVTDLSTARIRIRMCFDKVSDTSLNVTVTMTVGENSATHAGTIDGFAAMVSNSTGYQIGVAENATGISFYSTEKEYKELTFRDFGLADGAYTSKCWKQNTELTTLDGVAITGDMIFSKTGANGWDEGFRLSPIGSNNCDWTNFQIFHRNDATGNYIGVRYTGYGPFALNFTPAELDITDISTARIKIRMCFDKVSDTSLNVTVTMTVGENNSVIHAGTIDGISAMISNSAGYQIGVAEEATGISVYSTEREYKELTFRDFGLADGTYKAPCWMKNSLITTLDGVAITGDMTFTKTSSDGFNTGFRLSAVGSANCDWVNFQIFRRNNEFIGVRYVNHGAFFLNFTPSELGISDLSTEKIRIRMCFDKLGATSLNVTVTMTVGENSATHSDTIDGITEMISNSAGYQIGAAGSVNEISIASTTQSKSLSDVTYNIEEKPYVLNGCNTVTVDGVEKNAGDTLTKAGDYTVTTDQSGILTERQVSLYVVGDVDLSESTDSDKSGITLTKEDEAELKRILGYEKKYTELTFSHFGVDDNTYTRPFNGSNTEITSLAGVAFTGDYIFGTTGSWHTGFRLSAIGSSNPDWVNFQIFRRADGTAGDRIAIRYQGYGPLEIDFTKTELGVEDLGTTRIRIRTCFDKISDTALQVTVTATVGETSLTKTGTIDGITTLLSNAQGYNIGAAGSATNVSFYSAQVEKKETTVAQTKAADINNDGKVNNTDLKLLQDIVKADNPAEKRQEILNKYYVDALSFEYLGGDEVMPIVGFYGPDAEHLTEEVFASIKESGVNLISYPGIQNMNNPGAVLESLKLAEEYSIGMLVDDANINPLTTDENGDITTDPDTQLRTDEEVANLIGRYSYYDSYLGNFIVDEPTTTSYLYYTKIMQQLSSKANIFGYLNLPAGVWYRDEVNGMKDYPLHTKNISEYEEMVKEIVANTNAKVLSFDRYLTDVDAVITSTRYMLNLDIIRKQASDAEIPFWAYVPTGGKWKAGSGSALPTEAEFYWQVNMNLAFGAKGIQYYTLVETDEHDAYLDSLGEGETAGILDADYAANESGNYAWYTFAKNANKQISVVDEILMKSNSKGVVVSGGYAKDNTTDFEIGNYETGGETTKTLDAIMTCDQIKSADGVSRVASISGEEGNAYGVLTGVFDYQGKVALYVVNFDSTAEQDITVAFKNLSNYRLIYAEDADTVVDSEAIGSSCTVTLGAGQAALIVIEEEDLATTTQHFDDISMYRGTTFTAPELEGYVFAGWYTSEEAGKDYAYVSGQTAASSDEKSGAILASKKDGEAWAKYVDESILSVKGQISTDVTAESDTARIRIVTSTNSLIYQDIGFDIETRGKTATAMGTKVFEKIKASSSNGNLVFGYTPQESFDSHSYYFSTAILKVKAKDYLDESIIIKPFWTTADGTKVYGVTRSLTVNQGIQANQANSGGVYSSR